MLKSVRKRLMDYLLTGVLAVVPAVVTVAALAWVWQLIDGPLSRFFHFVTATQGDSAGPWSKLWNGVSTSKYSETIGPLVGLVFIVAILVLVGLILRSIAGRFLLGGIESAITRLPVVGMLYGSVKQLGEAFISKDSGSKKFQRAVAVQFPSPGIWAIGFVTGPGENILNHVPAGKNIARPVPTITVFVPTSPLPTQGFMMVVPTEETMELSMSVQDALKMVVSGGMIAPTESQKMKKPEDGALPQQLEQVAPLRRGTKVLPKDEGADGVRAS